MFILLQSLQDLTTDAHSTFSPFLNPTPSFNYSYTLATHVYPSAYPRTPSLPLPRAAYADVPGETIEPRAL
ncbi:hypothetical protein K439DRAFT_1637426 [Ramaria rubella]|nr:hypothetical protein K439DRAFT_1637426 [Ramaria rubella]